VEDAKTPINNKYKPSGMTGLQSQKEDKVHTVMWQFLCYCRAIPMADTRRELRIPFFVIIDVAVKKVKLNKKAPICFVALKVKKYVTPKAMGLPSLNSENKLPIFNYLFSVFIG